MIDPALLPDGAARQRIHGDLDATLFVEAAAGTGKTTALVARVIALVRTGRARLDRIVAVTFTEKAAGEMKLRLRAMIEEARVTAPTMRTSARSSLRAERRTKCEEARSAADVEAEELARLDEALAHLELARVGTIHSFCADLLRERPVEARIDPLFEVAAEREAESLLDAAFDSWFERILADPPEGVRRILRRRKRRRDEPGPKDLLRNAAASLAEHRDFDAPWRREPFDREAAIDRLMERLREVAAVGTAALAPSTYLAKSFGEIARFCDEVELLEKLRPRDHDGLEGQLRLAARESHWRWRGSPGRPFTKTMSVDEARSLRDGVKRELDAVLEACDADLAPRLRDELRPVIEAYERMKARQGKLDFLDLLVRARDLVRDDVAIRRGLRERFSHFFVDEFQDTDPLQAEILLLLAADDPAVSDWRLARPVAGKLFVVGDPKQSIYRFRRADVSLYEDVKRQLIACGAELVHLRASFRARPSIQATINAAFGAAMGEAAVRLSGGEGTPRPFPMKLEAAVRLSGGEGTPRPVSMNEGTADGSQATYVPLERVRDDVERPTVVVLPVPRPYGDYGKIVKWRIEESFPDAVGAFADWLVRESGWGIEPRHVCILFRRLQSFGDDVTRPYVRALEARRLPHVLVGGRSFHARDEVLALRNAVTAIEWPDDELHVFATMRGPLFALHDDSLLAFRHAHGRLQPLRWVTAGRRETLGADERAVADALAVIGGLHDGRNQKPIAETITRLLAAVRAHAGIAIWPTGEQALANCLRVVELARAFERFGAPSFRAFVELLEEEAERGRSEEAPVVEEGTEGIRLMTVHRAKGLEFPVVILADPTCRSTREEPSRHVDPARRLWAEPLCGSVPPDLRDAAADELRRDQEEAVRVAYVAATRARDLLVLPGVGDLDAGDEILSGWLEVLGPAIYPRRASRRSPERPAACPPLGSDSVAARPPEASTGPAGSVAPGAHRGALGGSRVVWWGPAALRLDVEEEVGLRQEKILVADESGAAATEGREAWERWRAARDEALRSGEEPSIRVETVTMLAARGSGDSAVAIERVAGDPTGRPGGRRFGALVHSVLAVVELDAEPAAARRIASVRARALGASTAELEAVVPVVMATLRHPLLRRALSAAERGALRREVPILLRGEDGTLVEGTADLAFFEEGGRWTVVDFKTDREIAARQEEYERQVAAYAHAIALATGHPADPYLLLV